MTEDYTLVENTLRRMYQCTDGIKDPITSCEIIELLERVNIYVEIEALHSTLKKIGFQSTPIPNEVDKIWHIEQVEA